MWRLKMVKKEACPVENWSDKSLPACCQTFVKVNRPLLSLEKIFWRDSLL